MDAYLSELVHNIKKERPEFTLSAIYEGVIQEVTSEVAHVTVTDASSQESYTGEIDLEDLAHFSAIESGVIFHIVTGILPGDFPLIKLIPYEARWTQEQIEEVHKAADALAARLNTD